MDCHRQNQRGRFNPRTYIRYDFDLIILSHIRKLFQSTYLYKVRLMGIGRDILFIGFQSTYLYKVRQNKGFSFFYYIGFNPRTYIRYDGFKPLYCSQAMEFQSTYLYKVRLTSVILTIKIFCFNPRTYIRYDILNNRRFDLECVSIHVPI